MKVIRLVEANITVNDIKTAIKNRTDKNSLIKDVLLDFFTRMKHYGGNEAVNILNILNNFDVGFIDYFFQCLGYENLSDRSNLILTAFSNKAAQNLVKGNKAKFVQLFNIVNNPNLNINQDYLSDSDALIFNNDLYNLVSNQDLLEDIIVNDVKNIKDPKWRLAVKNNIKTGEIGRFASKDKREDRQMAQVTEIFNNMKDDKKLQ